MEVKLQRVNDAVHFIAQGTSNVDIHIDGSPDIGGENAGARPMELILMGLASCGAIDIIGILKKQRQRVDRFDVTVDAERAEEYPKVFKKINVHYIVSGNVEEEKLKRAINLSKDKYCSATHMLNKTAEINYTYEIN